jgi:hypothetical protein
MQNAISGLHGPELTSPSQGSLLQLGKGCSLLGPCLVYLAQLVDFVR